MATLKREVLDKVLQLASDVIGSFTAEVAAKKIFSNDETAVTAAKQALEKGDMQTFKRIVKNQIFSNADEAALLVSDQAELRSELHPYGLSEDQFETMQVFLGGLPKRVKDKLLERYYLITDDSKRMELLVGLCMCNDETARYAWLGIMECTDNTTAEEIFDAVRRFGETVVRSMNDAQRLRNAEMQDRNRVVPTVAQTFGVMPETPLASDPPPAPRNKVVFAAQIAFWVLVAFSLITLAIRAMVQQ